MFSKIAFVFVAAQLYVRSAIGDYVAAVANHDMIVTDSDSPDYLLSKNIELYENLTKVGSENGAKVIVFPEFGLTPVASADERSDLYPFIEIIPDVNDVPLIPCEDSSFSDRPILQRMSCSSRYNNILVLVNMIDNVACSAATDSKCPTDNHYQFNTDVLFDESGAIVAKYHKSHEWPGLLAAYDQPDTPSRVSYKSPVIGVEFGLFTCFDIMFEDPARELVKEGVQHFLYPVQQGVWGDATLIPHWSKQNQATILASNVKCGDPTSAAKLDFSKVFVNGEELTGKKVFLDHGRNAINENVLIVTVPS
jgi:predicted amidohydrolase